MIGREQVEAVARKLTKAQRWQLLDLSELPWVASLTLPAMALRRKGLAERTGTLGGPPNYCRDEYRLTPLGLAVRKYIQEQDHG